MNISHIICAPKGNFINGVVQNRKNQPKVKKVFATDIKLAFEPFSLWGGV